MTPTVHHGDDDDCVWKLAKEDAIGEPLETSTTRFAMEDAIALRILANALDGSAQLISKLGAEAKLLLFVPLVRLERVGTSFAPKDDSLHLGGPFISSRTCSQGMPIGPSRSSASSR